MIIEKLIVNNFRVFSGEVEVDLTPANTNTDVKPVILFGGLNGAGKTSILTAVRLAIFGKHAFGKNIAKKEYQKILGDLSHRSKNGLTSDDSSVQIFFQYVKQGETFDYKVSRSWLAKEGVEELLIYENGLALSELSAEQAQSFLLDLIPIGVADLFFFDGEKIKELAEEHDNAVLADALKKMIGVDFIERGVADLTLLLKSKKKESADEIVKASIIELEESIEALEKEIVEHLGEIDNAQIELTAEKKELEQLELKLKSEGGDWVSSRDELMQLQGSLEARKKNLMGDCLDEFRGNLPFTLAPKFMSRLFSEAETALVDTEKRAFNSTLLKKKSKLRGFFNSEVTNVDIDSLIDYLSEEIGTGNLSHITPAVASRIEELQVSNVRDKNALKNILKKIEGVEIELDELGKNLARVPDQASLEIHFAKLSQQQVKIERLSLSLDSLKELCRDKVNEAIDKTKAIEKLNSQIRVKQKDVSVVQLAETSIKVLEQLTSRLVEIKVREIEGFFKESFDRMTRKDDMNLTIQIEPRNFDIELVSMSGHVIDKNRLSAGEKQIYALAILEALGKASGRKLPFIIDTPLGRLDSKHREKIVNEFFPKVNEQVIILSTDTEVDEKFYKDLEPHLAKSYALEYDSDSGSTSVAPGYFWRKVS